MFTICQTLKDKRAFTIPGFHMRKNILLSTNFSSTKPYWMSSSHITQNLNFNSLSLNLVLVSYFPLFPIHLYNKIYLKKSICISKYM